MSKKNIDEIVEEKLPTFANMVKDMKSKEELEGSLIIYLREKEGLIIQKTRDEELVQLKERKTKLSKPYNQTINALKNMMECIYKFGHKFEDGLKQEFEKNLVAYARQLSDVKRQKNEDKELNAIGEMIKEINEDYDPTIKTLEMKCEYVSFVLKERFSVDVPQVEV
jgi:RNA processing factor Prp31